jgi:hypothetical protein
MANDLSPLLKEAAQIPGLLRDIYSDAAKPGVQQVGRALATVLGLGNTMLWPIALLNARAKLVLQHNLEKYRERLKAEDPEKIVPVPPEIGVPIAEKLTYIADDEIGDLYVNLLASASIGETAGRAHPSFVHVIANLSPDEARMLPFLTHDIPFVEARLVAKKGSEFAVLGSVLTGIEFKADLLFPENVQAYFSNLEGLGIISVRRDVLIVRSQPTYESISDEYRQRPLFTDFDKDSHELRFMHGKIEVTHYGALFVEACLSNRNGA